MINGIRGPRLQKFGKKSLFALSMMPRESTFVYFPYFCSFSRLQNSSKVCWSAGLVVMGGDS